MFSVINEEVIELQGVKQIVYFVLDSSDYVVDILTDGGLRNILNQGIAIEGVNYNRYTNRIQNIRLQGGILPPKFRHFSMQSKVFLLNLQKEGACLAPTEEFRGFYGDGSLPVEDILPREVGKLISYTVYRNMTKHFKFLNDFVFYLELRNTIGFAYDNKMSKVYVPLNLDLSLLDANLANNVSQTGSFQDVWGINPKSGEFALGVTKINGKPIQAVTTLEKLSQYVYSGGDKNHYPWRLNLPV